MISSKRLNRISPTFSASFPLYLPCTILFFDPLHTLLAISRVLFFFFFSFTIKLFSITHTHTTVLLTMANFTSFSSSLTHIPPISAPSSVAFDDSSEDSCSICLEPFTFYNPSDVCFDPPLVFLLSAFGFLRKLLTWTTDRMPTNSLVQPCWILIMFWSKLRSLCAFWEFDCFHFFFSWLGIMWFRLNLIRTLLCFVLL